MSGDFFVNRAMGYYGAYITSAMAVNPDADTAYMAFTKKKFDSILFAVKLREFSFDTALVEYRNFDPMNEVLSIIIHIRVVPPNVYPIPVALSHTGFYPLLGPTDPALSPDVIPVDWCLLRLPRQEGGAARDRLSNYLQRSMNASELSKTIAWAYLETNTGYGHVTYYTAFTNHPLIIKPNDAGAGVHIMIQEFAKYSPKADNFLPTYITNPFIAADLIYKKYLEFMHAFQDTGYPHDRFLSGPEAFECANCQSLVIPSCIETSVEKFGKNERSNSASVSTHCPYCGNESRLVGYQYDENFLLAAGELFWICPNDLSHYQVVEVKDNRKMHLFHLRCPVCNQLVQKSVLKDLEPIISSRQNMPSTNVRRHENTNFLYYDFTQPRASSFTSQQQFDLFRSRESNPTAGGTRSCDFCHQSIEGNVCPSCHGFQCPKCQTWNTPDMQQCMFCDEPRPAS